MVVTGSHGHHPGQPSRHIRLGISVVSPTHDRAVHGERQVVPTPAGDRDGVGQAGRWVGEGKSGDGAIGLQHEAVVFSARDSFYIGQCQARLTGIPVAPGYRARGA